MPTFAGDIEVMPVEDVVAWLANRNRSGTLHFTRGNVERSFVIDAGLVKQGASNDSREYLGQHLINFGYIDEEQLEKAFQTQRETDVPLGRILVMVGELDEEQLRRALSFKVRESLLDTLDWQLGTFSFELDELGDPELHLDVPVSLAEVHSEGLSRRQMWAEMLKIFTSREQRFEVISTPGQVKASESFLLSLLQRGMSINDLLLEMRALEFHVYARLYDLHTRGHIRLRAPGEQAPPPPPPEDLQQALQDAMARQDYQQAYASAQKVLAQDSHNAEAIAALGMSAKHVKSQIEEQAIDRSMVPRLSAEASSQSAGLSAKERYVLSRVDGERTLNQIIQVSPIGEVEFLSIVGRLQEHKLITLG